MGSMRVARRCGEVAGGEAHRDQQDRNGEEAGEIGGMHTVKKV